MLVIGGQVSLAELESYDALLKVITGGEGRYLIEFRHYEAFSDIIQKQFCHQHQPNEA